MPGRPPKSAAQHKLEGTYQKCRHEGRGTELKPILNADCPAEITGEAKTLWKMIVPEMCDKKLVTKADLPSLKDAFQCYQIAQELYKKVDDAGGPAAYLMNWQSGEKDLLFEARRYMDTYEKIMWKFGVTPQEAAKVRGVKKTDEADDSAILAIKGNG